ncbi:hypothetical protein ACQ86O_24140 [Serratia sp. L9]
MANEMIFRLAQCSDRVGIQALYPQRRPDDAPLTCGQAQQTRHQ